jgi:hypothetical protein
MEKINGRIYEFIPVNSTRIRLYGLCIRPGRIANALVTISTVLFIWLSLRIAVQTRDRDDSNIVSKSLSSLFGVLVVYGTFIAWTINGGLITGTINGFKGVAEAGKSAGVELSESAVFFMDYYSNLSEPANTPSAPASHFLQ